MSHVAADYATGMCSAAKFLVWLGLSMLALGGWPGLAMSCDGDMRAGTGQSEASLPTTDAAHEHHVSPGAGTAGAVLPDVQCCGDCVASCASAGGTLLLQLPAGSPDVARDTAAAICPDALPPGPPPAVPFRPPIRLA